MKIYTKPENLDGAKLRQELNAAGIKISDANGAVRLDGLDLTLQIAAKDESAAEAIVAAHNG